MMGLTEFYFARIFRSEFPIKNESHGGNVLPESFAPTRSLRKFVAKQVSPLVFLYVAASLEIDTLMRVENESTVFW
jgi:hypothetical protein